MTLELSICIPTYNRARLLEECLDAILSQAVENASVEILISDNKSTDNTRHLVQQYQMKYPFIRYFCNTKNVDFDGNIIVCIEQAQGEYISFVSDDDLAVPEMYRRILEEIRLKRPSIIYLNHHPFFENNPKKRLPDLLVSKDRLFQNGKDFFLFCGLGFISSLIVRSDLARKYIPQAKNGLFGQAQLEIVSRIALSNEGPFLFLGSISIAARASTNLSDDYVTTHVLNVDRLYQKLYAEGLLNSYDYQRRIKNSIKSLLLRNILYNKCIGNHHRLASQEKEIIALYGRYPSFYLYIYPALLLPRFLIKPPYLLLRFVSRSLRKIRYSRFPFFK